MNNEHFTLSLLDFVQGTLCILLAAALFFKSCVIPGLNPSADILRAFAMADSENYSIIPGDIFDCKGVPIVVTEELVTGEGKEETREVVSTYTDALAYSQLIGYPGKLSLDRMNAETVEDVVGDRSGYRLMSQLGQGQFASIGIYAAPNRNGTKGNSVTLTIDHDIQEKAAAILKEQVSVSGDQGSIVVLDAQTGAILACVSYPAYDFNDLSTAKAQMEKEKEEWFEPTYPLTTKNANPPGSIWKVFMSACLLENGMGDFLASDSSFEVDGVTIRGTGITGDGCSVNPQNDIDYKTALKRSSNSFFANAAVTLGSDTLNEFAARFGMVEAEEGKPCEFPLDLANIAYHWSLTPSSGQSRDSLLAYTGFGQGKVELSTLYAGMFMTGITNGGRMLKPYLIEKITTEKGKPVYQGKSELFDSKTPQMKKKTARLLLDALRETAEYNLNLHHLDERTKNTFRTYDIGGKTGTAELGSGFNTAWYMSCAPAEKPEYIVIMNHGHTHDFGYQLMPGVAKMYDYLFRRTPND